jgi:UDP-2,4-diacetamido-2,4,6-trideoxy-beta-L-altropyranose hydrolase
MVKILFRVDANTQIGHGHFYRCVALAEMLSEDDWIAFASINLSPVLQNEISERGWHHHSIENDYSFSDPDALREQPIVYDLGSLTDGYDIIVLDGYHFSEDYFKTLKVIGKKVIYIDDLGISSKYVDCMVNHAPSASCEMYQPNQSRVIYALGLDYALIRKQFRQLSTTKRQHNHLLLILGGTNPSLLTEKIINWLLNDTDYVIHFVSDQISFTDLKVEFEERVHHHRQLPAERLVKLMNQCSLGIVPASTLSIEALSCHLPVLIGTLTDNQKNIYDSLISKYAIIGLGDFEELKKDKLLEAIRRVDKFKYEPDFIDFYIELRYKSIVKLLLQNIRNKDCLQMRKVTTKDENVIHQINDSPVVRSRSFNSATIDFTDHQKWFEKKLSDPGCFFYLFENESGQTVGFTRFDINGSIVLSSIALHTDFMGRGMGTEMLIKSVEEVRRHTDLKIIAQIKEDNPASRRAFEKAAFIFDTKILVNNISCDQFRYAY